jgi:hypothetical protein
MSKVGKLFGTNKRCLTFRRRCLMMFEKEDRKTRSMSQASLLNEEQCRDILNTPPWPPPQHNKTSRYLVSPCLTNSTKVKVKLSLQQAVKAHRVVRRRGSHIFLDNRVAEGGEIVSLTRRPPFTHWKIPSTQFCLRLSRTQGHSAAGRITTEVKMSLGHSTMSLGRIGGVEGRSIYSALQQ